MNRKKIAAGFISFALMMQSCVFAVSAVEENKTANFEYDDFSVSYSVTNSYGNTEVVSLTLTNTGDETIEDWMLYFEPNGDIQYVTNATEMTAENGKMYFKNNGYNADIAPSSAVTFTYAVNDCTEIPDYYALCQTRVEKTEGYDVSLSVGESWGDSFNGSIVITNHTDKPIEAWELSIDTNFTITEISNSWAATVTELDEYQYLLKGTYTSTIAANSSVSLGFIGVKSGEPEISSYSLTEMKEDTSKMTNSSIDSENYIDLKASTKKLSNEEDSKVIFYADTDLEVNEIDLISLDNNTVVATLKDDGDLEKNGDEYMNDGIYSCAINIDNSELGDKNFVAVCKNIYSNTATIAVYRLFTQQELDDMNSVDSAISILLNSNEFNEYTEEEQIQNVQNLLQELAQVNGILGYALIQNDSIIYDDISKAFEFKYACGVNSYLILYNEKEYENLDSIESNDGIIDTNILKDAVGLYGDAYVMDAFEKTRDEYYKLLNSRWNQNGLATTVNYDVTVETYRNIKNSNLIVFSAHGGIINDKINIITNEIVTDDKDNDYAYELYTSKTVSKCYMYDGYSKYNNIYCINSDFIKHNYNKDSFNGSIMFFECCDFYGEGSTRDTISTEFAQTFLDCGADTVIGFYNSVGAIYCRNLMDCFVHNLIMGDTTNQALIDAEDINGYDDGDGDGTIDYCEAIPLIMGKTQKYLVNPHIENGDFENNLKELTSWNYTGYANISKKMGTLTPIRGKRMALISTRTNEADTSNLYQTFKIPSYAKKLTFTYDVISEEPMEWVGEGYNDTFTAKLITMDGSLVLASESTDTSTWKRIADVNLPNGDNTTYHTGFITVTYDVSNLAGNYAKLIFEVKDSGDNTYETAVLIDNISLSK